jgi:hypothetical protein
MGKIYGVVALWLTQRCCVVGESVAASLLLVFLTASDRTTAYFRNTAVGWFNEGNTGKRVIDENTNHGRNKRNSFTADSLLFLKNKDDI